MGEVGLGGANGSLARRRILVVEDEVLVSLMIEDLLAAAGATVVGATGDSATALAMIEAEPLDCAILDYKLPDGTSLPVADELMSRSVPFLFASGYDASNLDPRYAEVPRVEKAYTPDELLQAIMETLRIDSTSRTNKRLLMANLGCP
jgi:DNA-binding response OmpR family regulator